MQGTKEEQRGNKSIASGLRWAFDVYTRVLSNSEIEQRGLGDLKGANNDGVGVDGIEELGRRVGNEDGWLGRLGVLVENGML